MCSCLTCIVLEADDYLCLVSVLPWMIPISDQAAVLYFFSPLRRTGLDGGQATSRIWAESNALHNLLKVDSMSVRKLRCVSCCRGFSEKKPWIYSYIIYTRTDYWNKPSRNANTWLFSIDSVVLSWLAVSARLLMRHLCLGRYIYNVSL